MDRFELQSRLKAFAFAVSSMINKLPYNALAKYFKDQIIRSAFSAAANYRAACIAQSRAAFAAKMSIAFEEIDESVFWLECIKESNFVQISLDSLLNEGIELSKILAASRKTSQQ